MRAHWVGTALFAALACATMAPASAAPPFQSSPPVAPLAGVVAGSPTIVVGNLSATGTSIQVHAVLRGSGIGSVLKVVSPSGPVNAESEPVVLFIDASGVPHWVGKATRPLYRGSLDDAVIHLQGISNPGLPPPVVSPGVLTLAQLQQFLATGGFDQTFDVTLGFHGVGDAEVSTTRHFTVHVQGVASAKPTVSVTGLSLACLGVTEVAIPDPPGNLVVRLEDTCRSSTRSLELVGGFTGVDPTTGHVLARVEPSRPALTEREFDVFARDGSIVDMRPVMAVSSVVLPWEAGGWESWTWHLASQSLVDPSGKTHKHAEPPTIVGPGASKTTFDFGDAGITLTGAVRPGASCVFSRRGQPDVPCRLEPQGHDFVRR